MATDKGFFNYWVVENSGKDLLLIPIAESFGYQVIQAMSGYVMIFLNQEIGVQEIVQPVKQNQKHRLSLQILLTMQKMHGMLIMKRVNLQQKKF